MREHYQVLKRKCHGGDVLSVQSICPSTKGENSIDEPRKKSIWMFSRRLWTSNSVCRMAPQNRPQREKTSFVSLEHCNPNRMNSEISPPPLFQKKVLAAQGRFCILSNTQYICKKYIDLNRGNRAKPRRNVVKIHCTLGQELCRCRVWHAFGELQISRCYFLFIIFFYYLFILRGCDAKCYIPTFLKLKLRRSMRREKEVPKLISRHQITTFLWNKQQVHVCSDLAENTLLYLGIFCDHGKLWVIQLS